MKWFGLIATMVATLIAPPALAASSAPSAGAVTAVCNDGTTQTAATRLAVCRGHKGIKTSDASAAPRASRTTRAATSGTPAAGGGPGQVWVNTHSKTKAYDCQGSRFYGLTKQGKYMSTADAQAAGYHASKSGACK